MRRRGGRDAGRAARRRRRRGDRASGGTGRPRRSTRSPGRATRTCSTRSPRTGPSSTSTSSWAWSGWSRSPPRRTSARRSTRRRVVGQIHGGTAQGLGLALMEEIQVVDGLVRNPSFTDYLIPTILDMPPMTVDVLELADPHAPYGLRGVGEPPTISSTPAIVAAIRAATGLAADPGPGPPEHIDRDRDERTAAGLGLRGTRPSGSAPVDAALRAPAAGPRRRAAARAHRLRAGRPVSRRAVASAWGAAALARPWTRRRRCRSPTELRDRVVAKLTPGADRGPADRLRGRLRRARRRRGGRRGRPPPCGAARRGPAPPFVGLRIKCLEAADPPARRCARSTCSCPPLDGPVAAGLRGHPAEGERAGPGGGDGAAVRAAGAALRPAGAVGCGSSCRSRPRRRCSAPTARPPWPG